MSVFSIKRYNETHATVRHSAWSEAQSILSLFCSLIHSFLQSFLPSAPNIGTCALEAFSTLLSHYGVAEGSPAFQPPRSLCLSGPFLFQLGLGLGTARDVRPKRIQELTLRVTALRELHCLCSGRFVIQAVEGPACVEYSMPRPHWQYSQYWIVVFGPSKLFLRLLERRRQQGGVA